MTSEGREEALRWLASPDLVTCLRRDLSSLGVVARRRTLLVCYLATLSRKCERPFGVLAQYLLGWRQVHAGRRRDGARPTEDLVAVSQ